MKKKNKISPIEVLRDEIAEIKDDFSNREYRIKNNMEYLKGNFGSLLFSSFITSSKNSIVSLFNGITGNSGEEVKGSSSFLDKVFAFSPLIMEIAQPILIGLATKKVKSLFTRKKKKKSN